MIRGRRGTLVVVALAWESTAFRPGNHKIFRAALQYTAPPCSVRTQCTTARLLTLHNDGRMQREAQSIFLSMLRARISYRSENCNGDSWRFVAVWSKVGPAMQTVLEIALIG